MIYNCWKLTINPDRSTELLLDESDTADRIARKKFEPSGTMGRFWIYFPRKNEEINSHYKKVLIDYVQKIYTGLIDEATEVINSIKAHS
jgi:hypothetical protein